MFNRTQTKMSSKFADRYLKRIEYNGDLNPTLPTLEALCWSNVTHVPYFTLDLFGSGERKTIDLQHIERNIIEKNWGGMCYELNAMFYLLLKDLGFNVKIIRGEFFAEGKEVNYKHMGLLVRC